MRQVYMDEDTTIRLKKQTREKMKKKRITKKETYDEIINRLMKSILIIGCFVFLISFSSALTYVDKCMDLNIAGETYVQNASIVKSGTSDCINITNQNITFDGAGFKITLPTSGGFGKYAIKTSQENTIVKNISINITETETTMNGIYFNNANNSRLINSNINGTTIGLIIAGTNFSGENLTIFNKYGGIGITSLGDRMQLTNIRLIDGDYSDTMLNLLGATNGIIRDSLILTNPFSEVGSTNSVYLHTTSGINSTNMTLINVTYNNSLETVETGNSLTRKWYFDAQANNSLNGNPLANVNISGRDNTNALIFSVLTQSNGRIPTQTLTEYVNNGGVRTYYNDYNITGVFRTQTSSQAVNLTTTNNTFLQFLFQRQRPQLEIADGIFRISDGRFRLTD